MATKACKCCGRLFEDYFDTNELCQKCREEEQKVLRDVKDYLWVNPGTTETKLEELFGVTRKQTQKWLREGRLELTPDSAIKLTCMRCGSMILTGKYCKDCINRLTTGFKENTKEDEEKESAKIKMAGAMVIDRRAKSQGAQMRFFKK
ncbi:MAG: hypothetical protein K6B41_00880 [Butyrivibrio sp.]|nr:hypothetical protein [Butyrivibrio sp.]